MSTEKRPPISVVIPTYNGKHLLEQHLPTVLKVLDKEDEIIIVDDASTDETKSWFAHWTREYAGEVEIRLVINKTNQRFARTANKGVSLAHHEWIFLLNNDVAPRIGVLDELWKTVRTFEKEGEVFAVGCKEYEPSPKDQKEKIVGGKNRLWFERGFFLHSRATNWTTGVTAWASGGSALFNAHLWQELGGFDELFAPAYWEDIDLSFRAYERGWQILFSSKAEVDHHHETTNTTVFGRQHIEYMSWRNGIFFTWKHMNSGQWLQHLWWLPYHIFVTSYRTKGLFIKALLAAIGLMVRKVIL